MDLLNLLGKYECRVEYNKSYDNNWSINELLENIIDVDCSRCDLSVLSQMPNYETNWSAILSELPYFKFINYDNKNLLTLSKLPNCKKIKCDDKNLIILPELEKCEYLFCKGNKLTTLPKLIQCIYLVCPYNQLTVLPKLSKCTCLDCSNNKLTFLPKLANCIYLDCSNNKLTFLPELTNCVHLYCSNNPLPFFKLSEWKIVWKFRKYYMQIKYFKLWYKRMLQFKDKRYDLHCTCDTYLPSLKIYVTI